MNKSVAVIKIIVFLQGLTLTVILMLNILTYKMEEFQYLWTNRNWQDHFTVFELLVNQMLVATSGACIGGSARSRTGTGFDVLFCFSAGGCQQEIICPGNLILLLFQ